MSQKRPPSMMGDDERIAIGAEARRTPRHGIPIEVDPEVTPAPAEPPDITQLDGFDAIAPEIRAPLLALHHTQRELDVALNRMWSSRHVHDELAHLQSTVDVLSAHLTPIKELGNIVRSQAGQLNRIVLWMESQTKRDDRLDRLLDALDKRLDAMERDYAGVSATMTQFGQRVDHNFGAATRSLETTNARIDAMDGRLRAVETTHAGDADLKALELTHGARLSSLEETRTRTRGAIWALGAIITAAAAIGGFALHELWRWLTGQK